MKPHVLVTNLNRNWMGLAAAIDWIIFRGEDIPASEYSERYDRAARALVDALADQPKRKAKSLARGVPVRKPDSPLRGIHPGIWSQTASHDFHDEDLRYQLVGTDDENNEWEGAILGRRKGYRRVQISTDFVLKNWPAHRPEIEFKSQTKRFSPHALKLLVEKIIADAPDELRPLTDTAILQIVNICMPGGPREAIKNAIINLRGPGKSGPRGPRCPDRQKFIEEFSRKILAGELEN